MCGIFFTSSRRDLERPSCLENISGTVTSGDFVLECGELDIEPILSHYVADQTRLTQQDQSKLNNVSKLQQLQQRLNEAKNARKPDMVEQLELQLALLTPEVNNGEKKDNPPLIDRVIPEILARGPNYAEYREANIGPAKLQLFSSVLSLRQPFTKQPIVKTNYILQFNGELYNDECQEINDTQFISQQLDVAFESCSLRQEAIISTISQLNGEFAFVLTDLAANKVYFGKDYVGKRSLLYSIQDDGIVISSVLPDFENVIECKSDSIHCFDLASAELVKFPYQDLWRHKDIDHKVSFNPIVAEGPTSNEKIDIRVQQLYKILKNAALSRQSTIHPLHPTRDHLELGILFSGGLDCTVLAGIIARNYIEAAKPAVIDLLTVGFENPRTGLGARDSPDRKLSERSWFELSKVFCNTSVKFRLVQVDVRYSEWLSHKKRVLDLISPRATEMDLSIAIAFYFACRAQNCEAWEVDTDISSTSWSEFSGSISTFTKTIPNYTSDAKVLFLGLGADELFGGYSRHEGIFNDLDQSADSSVKTERYNHLSASLISDIQIIYERNLGRDDRAMASWGKELRYPFLDNNVILFVVSEIEPDLKIRFDWQTVKTKKGEKTVKVFVRKYILRCLARDLGLSMAADEVKRAIQFGAKSAKLEVGKSKVKGTDAI